MSKNTAQHGEPGDLMALKARLWDGVSAAHDMLRSRSNDTRLRACHALGQLSNAYAKLVETAELEARIAALEAAREQDDG